MRRSTENSKSMNYLSSFWLLEDTGLRLYGDCGSLTILCLFGLIKKRVQLWFIIRFQPYLVPREMIFTCKRKDFFPQAGGPWRVALLRPLWSLRCLSRGSRSERDQHSRKARFLGQNKRRWGRGAPWAGRSIWRGCSPWLPHHLLFRTSCQGSPCPGFKFN